MIVATRRLTVVTSAPNRKGAWLTTECNRAEGEIRPQEEQTRHKRHETASVLVMNMFVCVYEWRARISSSS